MSLIIHGFPGIGKTTLASQGKISINGLEFSMIDLDSGPYRGSDRWPYNYLADISDYQLKYDMVFVSTHEEVVECLPYSRHNLCMWSVYPSEDMKSEMMNRYTSRPHVKEFVDYMEMNYRGFVRDLNDRFRNTGKGIELKRGQFLVDVLPEILEI